MGLRFRKSVKIAPGVRVNFGKKSASVSLGGKGGRVTYSTSGRKTTTVGIPGSGLSYSKTSKIGGNEGSKTVRTSQEKKADESTSATLNTPKDYWTTAKMAKNTGLSLRVVLVILAVASAFLGFAFPFMFILVALIIAYLVKTKKTWKNHYLDLEQGAREYEAIYPELCEVAKLQDKANQTNVVAELFILYERAEPYVDSILQKLRSFGSGSKYGADTLLADSFGEKIGELMEKEYKAETKAITKLKTRRGAESHIQGFRRVYDANIEKLTDSQRSAFYGYVADLERIRDMVAPE